MTGQDPMQPQLTLLFFGEGEWVLIKRTPETLPNLNQSVSIFKKFADKQAPLQPLATPAS